MPGEDEPRWRAVLDRIVAEIDRRDALLACGELRAMRAPVIDVPDELGPVPPALVPTVHEIVGRLAAQQAAVERELAKVGRELARCASARPATSPRSVDDAGRPAFEARA